MPAGQTTLSAVRDSVRQRCDVVNSQFVTDAELAGWINASYLELYDLLVAKYGDDYFLTSGTITTDGTNTQFALATDIYKLRGVELQLAADQWTTLQPFNFSERNRFTGPFPASAGKSFLRYHLTQGSLMLMPLPSSGQTIRYWYTPRPASVSADADVIDGVSGWEEYIVADVCVKVMAKQESDPSVFMAQKEALLRRIEAMAENRDAGRPQTVTDAYSADGWWMNGGEY